MFEGPEYDDIFSRAARSFMGDQESAHVAVNRADEWAAAARGECPEARKCSTRAELARWFQIMAIAAGAIGRVPS